MSLPTPEMLKDYITWLAEDRNCKIELLCTPSNPAGKTITEYISIRSNGRNSDLWSALGRHRPVARFTITLYLPIGTAYTYQQLNDAVAEEFKGFNPVGRTKRVNLSQLHDISSVVRGLEVEVDSVSVEDPGFGIINGPAGIEPLPEESINLGSAFGLGVTIEGAPKVVSMKTAPHVRFLAKLALLRKAAAHASERMAANDEAPVNQGDAAQAVAHHTAALAAAGREADQEEGAAGRAAADPEEAAQATAVLAAAGRAADQEEAAQAATRQTAAPAAAMQAAADQKEGPFTMVPTKQKRGRATATTPGNSPPRTRKSSTTAQQRMRKFWGENSDEETDEDTPMSGSDDEANGDIVEKITTTATGAGKRAAWVAKPLQAQRIAEEQKWRVTNRERLDAIEEMYARELCNAEGIREFFVDIRRLGTQSAKVAIFKPLYLNAVKRFRNSRQFKDQMQLINCPMQINILDFGPLFGGDDPAAAILLTFRSIADAVAAHELLMELHHKNEWPPFALEFVGQDV